MHKYAVGDDVSTVRKAMAFVKKTFRSSIRFEKQSNRQESDIISIYEHICTCLVFGIDPVDCVKWTFFLSDIITDFIKGNKEVLYYYIF